MEFEMSGVSTLEEELESSLQCPVCLLIPRTLPVPACPSGHIMCQVTLTSVGPDKSRDLNTDILLVQTGHVTPILTSYWSRAAGRR